MFLQSQQHAVQLVHFHHDREKNIKNNNHFDKNTGLIISLEENWAGTLWMAHGLNTTQERNDEMESVMGNTHNQLS